LRTVAVEEAWFPRRPDSVVLVSVGAAGFEPATSRV
jgi:hypothetical protein